MCQLVKYIYEHTSCFSYLKQEKQNWKPSQNGSCKKNQSNSIYYVEIQNLQMKETIEPPLSKPRNTYNFSENIGSVQ